jgi:hypothetical protein
MGRDVVELAAMVEAVCADLNTLCGELNKGIKQKLKGQALEDLHLRGEQKVRDYEELLAQLEATYRKQVEKKYGDFVDIARGFLARLNDMRQNKA